MNEKAKLELDRIVSTLADTGIVSKIILFGSHARGEDGPGSDIDICVLTWVKDKHPTLLPPRRRRERYKHRVYFQPP